MRTFSLWLDISTGALVLSFQLLGNFPLNVWNQKLVSLSSDYMPDGSFFGPGRLETISASHSLSRIPLHPSQALPWPSRISLDNSITASLLDRLTSPPSRVLFRRSSLTLLPDESSAGHHAFFLFKIVPSGLSFRTQCGRFKMCSQTLTPPPWKEEPSALPLNVGWTHWLASTEQNVAIVLPAPKSLPHRNC